MSLKSIRTYDGLLLLEESRHSEPLYDPDWLTGSWIVTMAVFCTPAWLCIYTIMEIAPSSSWPILLLGGAILCLLLVLLVVNSIRLHRDRTALHKEPWTTKLGESNMRNEHVISRYVCRGDEIEIACLLRDLSKVHACMNIVTSGRYVFLFLLSLIAWIGWIPVKYLDWPPRYAIYTILGIAFLAVVCRILFSTQIKIEPGILRVTKRGLLRMSSRGAICRVIDLHNARIDCNYLSSTVQIISHGVEHITINLWSLANRHAFVSALFHAALVVEDKRDKEEG